MYQRHQYAALGLQHRAAYEPPTRIDLDRWVQWAWNALGIVVNLTDELPDAVIAIAQPQDEEQLRGTVTLREDTEHPLWLLCHELGHLMTGQTYSTETAGQMRNWRRVPAESAATEYALGLYIGEDELSEFLSEGQSVDAAARRWQVPVEMIEWRLRLIGVRVG